MHIKVQPIERLALRFAPRRWDFAENERGAIAQHFEHLQRDCPSLWNGPVLVLHEHRVENGTLSGAYLQTDFDSLIAWRDWGFPDRSVFKCFSLGALQGADDAFLLGVMAGSTANAGRIYFPGGTPDPSDIFGDRVDLDSSVRREVKEETGLDAEALSLSPGWHMIRAGRRIALLKRMRSRQPAETLRERVRGYLASQHVPELADMYIARGPADLHPGMPEFITAFLTQEWRRADSENGSRA